MARKYETEGNIPASCDPRWLARCCPLIAFLAEGPKAWPELKQWSRKREVTTAMLQNMLSWLSIQRRIDLVAGIWHLVPDSVRALRTQLEAERAAQARREAPTARPGPWMFEEHGGNGNEEA